MVPSARCCFNIIRYSEAEIEKRVASERRKLEASAGSSGGGGGGAGGDRGLIDSHSVAVLKEKDQTGKIENQRQLRSAFFVDAGNVFNTECAESQINCFDVDADELRYSVGVGVTWISGFGPMTFSLAKPLNAGPDDREESFQFTLGRGF